MPSEQACRERVQEGYLPRQQPRGAKKREIDLNDESDATEDCHKVSLVYVLTFALHTINLQFTQVRYNLDRLTYFVLVWSNTA